MIVVVTVAKPNCADALTSVFSTADVPLGVLCTRSRSAVVALETLFAGYDNFGGNGLASSGTASSFLKVQVLALKIFGTSQILLAREKLGNLVRCAKCTERKCDAQGCNTRKQEYVHES